jgi:hypothetical protein
VDGDSEDSATSEVINLELLPELTLELNSNSL